MSEMPRVHVCQQPMCRRIVPISERYCDRHAPLHQAYQQVSQAVKREDNRHYNLYERDTEANSFYHSKSWQQVSNYVKNRDYYSDGVTGQVIPDGKLIVDHIVPRRLLTRDEALNADNLWCLSRVNHNIKTKMEQSIADKPNGDVKLRHLSKSWWQKVIAERIRKRK